LLILIDSCIQRVHEYRAGVRQQPHLCYYPEHFNVMLLSSNSIYIVMSAYFTSKHMLLDAMKPWIDS